jgi:hypothetical protein
MKTFALGVIALLACTRFCGGGEVEKMYYLGEAVLTSATGEPRGSHVILMEKTHDPDHHLIVERAIVVKADKRADEYTMNMTVSDNAFTLKDTANTVTGSGTLFGPAWRWTYFHATYQSRSGVKIEDENFMADPSVCVGRKKISSPDGKVVSVMDVTLKSITPKTFEMLSAALVKK